MPVHAAPSDHSPARRRVADTLDFSEREALHFQVLRILERNPNCSQRELARQLGLSLGRANYCLRALVEQGLMKVENFKVSSNKWGYAYVLTPAGIAEKMALTGRFLQRKLTEYEALKGEIASLIREHPEEVASLDIPNDLGPGRP